MGDLAAGTLIEYRAVSTDAAGQRSAASTYASVGNKVNFVEPEVPEEPVEFDNVSIAGDLNSEMGCASDWSPDCDQAQMELGRRHLDARRSKTSPPVTYEYKVATDKSWDVNFGANGVPNGGNISITHEGGTITFYFDPRSKFAQSTAEGPIVTLPGSQQSELGCLADWSPDCLRGLMFDGDKDGVYEFATSAIPTGAYETKVAHGLSWDENYGVDGVPGGGNYSFSATDGKQIVFRYTLATHVLVIEQTDPPLPGTGQSQAHWIDAETIAWPSKLGAPAADASWQLYSSHDATLAVDDGDVTGGDAVDLSLVAGGLTPEQKERFPALAEYTALHVEGQDRDAVASLLKGQLMVAQRDAGDELTAFTGVQIPGVLDDLYADAVTDVELGVTFQGSKPTFRLWAPTAQAATLLTWDPSTGSGTATGDPVRTEAAWDAASGTWTVAGKAGLKGDEYLWEVAVYAPTTTAIETNDVTDPYSIALTENSTRSVAIDLDDKQWRPKQWEKTKSPIIDRPVDRAIYELHIRDFSATDESVPEAERGTYLAFTRKSAGTDQLEQLAAAGINTVHLLPSFDIASIEENRAAQQTPDCDLASMAPDSEDQQACIERGRRDRCLQLGLRPVPLLRARGLVRDEPGRRGARRRIPLDGRRSARHGSAGRARRGVQPHRRVGSGCEVGARPGRARLLPAPQRDRRRRDLDVLPERRDRARGRRRSSWSTRSCCGPASTRSTASAST